MSNKPRPKKKYNPDKALAAGLVGIKISWEDTNPLIESSDIVNGDITHKTAAKIQQAKQIWSRYGMRITNSKVLNWRVKCVVVHEWSNGHIQKEEAELEHRCRLSQINGAMCDFIEESIDMNAGIDNCQFKHVRFECEVIDRKGVKAIEYAKPSLDEQLREALA